MRWAYSHGVLKPLPTEITDHGLDSWSLSKTLFYSISKMLRLWPLTIALMLQPFLLVWLSRERSRQENRGRVLSIWWTKWRSQKYQGPSEVRHGRPMWQTFCPIRPRQPKQATPRPLTFPQRGRLSTSPPNRRQLGVTAVRALRQLPPWQPPTGLSTAPQLPRQQLMPHTNPEHPMSHYPATTMHVSRIIHRVPVNNVDSTSKFSPALCLELFFSLLTLL